MARRDLFENAHALFATSDHHGRATKVSQQRTPRFLDRFFIIQGARDVEAGFLRIADNGPRAAISKKPRSLGFYKHGNIEFVAGVQNSFGETVGDQALVVIGQKKCIDRIERTHKQAKQLFFRLRRECIPALVIDAYDLLMASDNPRLYRRNSPRIGEYTSFTNFGLAQTRAECRTGFVIPELVRGEFPAPHYTEELHLSTQGSQIRSDIACAAQTIILRNKIHYRHGSFG